MTKGNLTLVRKFIDPVANRFIEAERMLYDGYGLVHRIYDPLGDPSNLPFGHFRTFTFDEGIHTYPVSETVHTGNSAMPTIDAEATYDVGLGVLETFTGFNDHVTTVRTDTFGRVADIIKPGDSAELPTISYSYQLSVAEGDNILSYIETRQREESGGGTFDSRTYFDGLGRKLQVRTESEHPGKVVVTEAARFNQRKSLWKVCQPYFATGALPFSEPPVEIAASEHSYDATLRETGFIHPPDEDGVRHRTATIYEPLATLLKDEEQNDSESIHSGAAKRLIYDGLVDSEGNPRLRTVEEIVKLSDIGEVLPEPVTWRTRYVLDLLNNIGTITDSQENIKVMRHDGLGRLHYMDDPDRGEMWFVHDAASNLEETRDSKGQVKKYTYDGANRPKTEDYLDAAGHSPDVEYFYDLAPGLVSFGDGSSGMATNVKGRLAFVRDLSGEEHQSYDTRGRIAWTVKILPDPVLDLPVAFRTGFGYDSMDRLRGITYPDGDSLAYSYNDRSLLDHVTGGPTGFIISSITYKASGQKENTTFGSGVVTERGYDPRLRLTGLSTAAPGGGERYLDYAYKFDGVSNITRIDDLRDLSAQPDAAARADTRAFVHDDLYRLTSANWSGSAGGTLAYAYDRIGNMLGKTSGFAHADGNGKPLAKCWRDAMWRHARHLEPLGAGGKRLWASWDHESWRAR